MNQADSNYATFFTAPASVGKAYVDRLSFWKDVKANLSKRLRHESFIFELQCLVFKKIVDLSQECPHSLHLHYHEHISYLKKQYSLLWKGDVWAVLISTKERTQKRCYVLVPSSVAELRKHGNRRQYTTQDPFLLSLDANGSVYSESNLALSWTSWQECTVCFKFSRRCSVPSGIFSAFSVTFVITNDVAKRFVALVFLCFWDGFYWTTFWTCRCYVVESTRAFRRKLFHWWALYYGLSRWIITSFCANVLYSLVYNYLIHERFYVSIWLWTLYADEPLSTTLKWHPTFNKCLITATFFSQSWPVSLF